MASPLTPASFDLQIVYAFAFSVPAVPKSQPRARHMSGVTKAGKKYSRTYNPDTNKAFKAAVLAAALNAAPKKANLQVITWSEAVRVDIDAFFPAPHWMSKVHLAQPVPMLETPDRDNLDKCVLDALTMTEHQPRGIWHNDSIVCQGEVRKWYAASGHGPGIRVSVEFLGLPDWYARLRDQHQQDLARARAAKAAGKRPASESHIATELYEADALPRLARQMRKGARR
jgi:Holliday junction resolvase RusA-like endonuclease